MATRKITKKAPARMVEPLAALAALAVPDAGFSNVGIGACAGGLDNAKALEDVLRKVQPVIDLRITQLTTAGGQGRDPLPMARG